MCGLCFRYYQGKEKVGTTTAQHALARTLEAAAFVSWMLDSARTHQVRIGMDHIENWWRGGKGRGRETLYNICCTKYAF